MSERYARVVGVDTHAASQRLAVIEPVTEAQVDQANFPTPVAGWPGPSPRRGAGPATTPSRCSWWRESKAIAQVCAGPTGHSTAASDHGGHHLGHQDARRWNDAAFSLYVDDVDRAAPDLSTLTG